MADLTDYERAITLSFELARTPHMSQEQRMIQSEASLYCERVESSPRGWVMTLNLLRSTRLPEAKFFCLQSIQKLLSDNGKYSQLSVEDRNELRTLFMTWVAEACRNLSNEEKFIKSKLGVVVALLIRRDYLSLWRLAFDDLLQLLSFGLGGADLFVSTLTALDEEVISLGGPEAMQVKDRIRETSVAPMIQALFNIAAMYADADPDLVRRCWLVCGLYVDWVDYKLSTEERFLRIWFPHCLDERFRTQAVGALNRLLQKGMKTPQDKLQSILELGLADACVDFCLRSALIRNGTSPVPHPPELPPLPSAWAMIMSQLPPSVQSPPPSPVSLNGSHVQDDGQFAVEAARFCQSLGMQLLECRKASLTSGNLESLDTIRPLMDRALFSLFSFMSRVDKIEVQNAVLEFANRLVTCNKDIPQSMLNGNNEVVDRANVFGLDAVHRLLFAVLSSVRLPVEYNLNSLDALAVDGSTGGDQDVGEYAAGDDESEFREHRGNVKRLFLNLVRCCTPKVVLPFILGIVEQCLASFNPKQPPHDLEAVLYLVHAFAEGAAEVAQRQGSPEDIAGFDRVLLAVFRSPVFHTANHPIIANMYNELAARYVVALRAQPVDLVAHVVERVVGIGGIHHPKSKVRSKAAVLLLRIVRSLETACAPLSERILLGLQDVLGLHYDLCAAHYASIKKKSTSGNPVGGAPQQQIQQQQQQQPQKKPTLTVPDVILVYETVGIILGLGNYWIDQNQRRMYLTAVLTPLQANLEQACTIIGTTVSAGKGEEVIHWAGCQLEAFASVAKGFPLHSDVPDILQLWKDVLRTSLGATIKLEQFTSDPEFLLNNLRRLCHSMNRTIGTEILVFFPDICRALLEAPNADICRALPLLNQMMTAFKSKMRDALVTSLLPILRATNARIAPVANRPSLTTHDRDELIAMEKELFTFLQAVAASDLAMVFFEGPNRGHLEELLTMVKDGMATVLDATVQRICAATLLALCKEWLGPASKLPEDLRPAFLHFTFEYITPASFQATSQPHFDVRDAACSALLAMVCTLHRTLFELCGQEWIEYVRRVFLVSVNCPASTAEQYCQAVMVSRNPKDIRTAFRMLFLEDASGSKGNKQ